MSTVQVAAGGEMWAMFPSLSLRRNLSLEAALQLWGPAWEHSSTPAVTETRFMIKRKKSTLDLREFETDAVWTLTLVFLTASFTRIRQRQQWELTPESSSYSHNSYLHVITGACKGFIALSRDCRVFGRRSCNPVWTRWWTLVKQSPLIHLVKVINTCSPVSASSPLTF